LTWNALNDLALFALAPIGMLAIAAGLYYAQRHRWWPFQ
jgi:hypothetical protein